VRSTGTEVIVATAQEIEEENTNRIRFEFLVEETMNCAQPMWHWGDGFGAYVIATLQQAAERRGLQWGPPKPARRKIAKTVKKSVLLQVVARDGFVCVYCQTKLDPANITLDHRIPLILGGESTLENLCVCCKTCNSVKSDRLMTPIAQQKRLRK
jgi:HNH endonuclease